MQMFLLKEDSIVQMKYVIISMPRFSENKNKQNNRKNYGTCFFFD